MANLIGTVIGIAFCALLLAAGANFLAPKGFVVHNQAAANTAQVSALITDYSNLAMATGHRPTYADYASVYSGGKTANGSYTNSNGAITTSATMAYTNAAGQSVPVGTWKFMPGCGVANGAQDCFCLTVPAGATDVTYQATRVSAINESVSTTQSRIEFSTGGCASATPVTNPVVCGPNSVAGTCWPAAAPANGYFLTVRLNNTGSGNTTNTPGPTGASSTPINGQCTTKNTCSSGTLSSKVTSSVPGNYGGTYTFYTWACTGSAGGSDDQYYPYNSNPLECSASDGQCAGTAPYAPYACVSPGPETNGPGNAQGPTWTCKGVNGGNDSPTCQGTNGVCDLSTLGGCNAGSNPSTATPNYTISGNTDTWTCNGINGGNPSPLCSVTYGACNTISPGNCVSGTAINVSPPPNTNGETWTCQGSFGTQYNVPCSSTNGICSTTTAGGCNSGSNPSTAIPPAPNYTVSSNGYTSTWSCNGSGGGNNASPSCTATNGVCDLTNPTPGHCLSGSNPGYATSTSGTNTVWTCSGLNGGSTPPQCSVPTSVPPPTACGLTVDTCLPAGATEINFGTFFGVTYWFCHGPDGNYVSCSDHIGICGISAGQCANSNNTATPTSDSSSSTTWVCDSTDGGTTSPQCSVPDAACSKPLVLGTCDPSSNSYASPVNSTGGWTCTSSVGGAPASCQMPAVNGACGNSLTSNPCSAGTLDPTSEADSGGKTTWVCDGSYSGTNTSPGQCSVPDGACDNTAQYGCAGGVTAINEVPDNGSGMSTWNCPAPNNDGGSNSSQCSIANTGGTCDYTQPAGGCLTGTPSGTRLSSPGPPYNDPGQSGQYTYWTCSGTRCTVTNGICALSNLNACASGTEGNMPSNSGQANWECYGQTGVAPNGQTIIIGATSPLCSVPYARCPSYCSNTNNGNGFASGSGASYSAFPSSNITYQIFDICFNGVMTSYMTAECGSNSNGCPYPQYIVMNPSSTDICDYSARTNHIVTNTNPVCGSAAFTCNEGIPGPISSAPPNQQNFSTGPSWSCTGFQSGATSVNGAATVSVGCNNP